MTIGAFVARLLQEQPEFEMSFDQLTSTLTADELSSLTSLELNPEWIAFLAFSLVLTENGLESKDPTEIDMDMVRSRLFFGCNSGSAIVHEEAARIGVDMEKVFRAHQIVYLKIKRDQAHAR